jgi:hypothetical protein
MTTFSRALQKFIDDNHNNIIAKKTISFFRSNKVKVFYFNQIYRSKMNTRQRTKFYKRAGFAIYKQIVTFYIVL